MTPEQVELLYRASQTPELTNDQRSRLTLANPWSQSGPVAQIMQRRVGELNADQARAWIAEAGASLSLEAAAAKQGLAPMTMAVQSELQRMEPVSADEAIEVQASEMAKQNPFLPQYQNLTKQLWLQNNKPELARYLQKSAADAQPKVGGLTPREQELVRLHGGYGAGR